MGEGFRDSGMYSYTTVEKAAWIVLDIQDADEKQPAWLAKIKYARRLGLLPNPGSGVRLQYDFERAFELICALKLQEGGMLPMASLAAAHEARTNLPNLGDETGKRFLVLRKDKLQILPKEEIEALIGREVFLAFVDLKLLCDVIKDALARAAARPKKKRLRRQDMAEHIFEARDGK
jgi:hypothetical protein